MHDDRILDVKLSLARVLDLITKLDANLTDARLAALYRSGKVRHASRKMLKECLTRVDEARSVLDGLYWEGRGLP